MSDQDRNVEVCVRANQELFGGGRLELAEQLFAPGFVDHGAPDGAPAGPAGPKATVGMIHAGVEDLSYEIEDAFGAGDRVALRVTMRGVHAGEFFGIPATGRRFSLKQIHIFRVADGKIAEHWPVRDDLGMMRQLGVIE